MDIRTKLMLALVSASLLSMALFGYLTYLLSEDLLLQNSSRQIAPIAASKAREFDNLVDGWRVEGLRLLNRVELSSALSVQDDTGDDIGRDGVAENQAVRLSQALESAMASNPAIRWMGVYDGSGERRAVTHPLLAPLRMTPLARDDAPSRASSRSSSLMAQQMPDGKLSLFLAMPLPAEAGPRMMLVGLDADPLNSLTDDRTGLGETGESLVVAPSWLNAEGELVDGYLIVSGHAPPADADMRSGRLTGAPAAISAALKAGEGPSVDSDYFGTPVLSSSRPLQNSGWRMLVKVNRSEELALVDELLADLRGLGLSLGALAILGGVFFGMYLARPIRRLADTVDRIRHGELELRAEVVGEDEVALLAQSFNEFMEQLDRSSDIFQLGELRVLVLESHAQNRHLLNELLTNWRMQAIMVKDEASALAAIDAAEQQGEPIQLMVLDHHTPDTDGIHLAARIAETEGWHRCPIIMLSNDSQPLDLDALRKMGVGHVVPKPVVASDLMEAILEEMGVSPAAMESMPDVYLTKTTPRKILLAEDSPIIQRVTVGFLEKWGHVVSVVGTGRLAVERMQLEAFDLVLMDLEMPEMNGLDATLQIREQESDGRVRTPIVALTARATKEDREACMAAGMDEYVSKPVDPKVLYRLIDSYPARVPLTVSPGVATKYSASEARMTNQESGPTEEGDSPVDWKVAQALTGGDADLLDELISLFPVESAKHLAAVRAGIDAEDADQLTRGAHSLKSAAGFFGAKMLVASALEMENLGRASSIAEARDRLPALEQETTRLNQALERERPAVGNG